MPFVRRNARTSQIQSKWTRTIPSQIVPQHPYEPYYTPQYVPQYTPYDSYYTQPSYDTPAIAPIFVTEEPEITTPREIVYQVNDIIDNLIDTGAIEVPEPTAALTSLQAQILRPTIPTFMFDLKKRIRGTDPTKESYDIHILEVTEFSADPLATLRIGNQSLFTVDTDGIVTYRPLGRYFGNQLRVKYQISDPNRPATMEARTQSLQYEGDGRMGSVSGGLNAYPLPDPEPFEQPAEMPEEVPEPEAPPPPPEIPEPDDVAAAPPAPVGVQRPPILGEVVRPDNLPEAEQEPIAINTPGSDPSQRPEPIIITDPERDSTQATTPGSTDAGAVDTNVTLIVSSKFVGEQGGKDLIADQTGPTCFVATMAGILKNSGVDTDYDDLLDKTAVRVDIDGNQISENAEITNDNGQAVYQILTLPNGSRVVSRQKTNRNDVLDDPDLTDQEKFDLIHGVNYAVTTSVPTAGLIESIEDEFGVEITTGNIETLSDIINPLENGQAVAVEVDLSRLTDEVRRVADESDREFVNGPEGSVINRVGYHAFNIVGFRVDDDGNLEFRINDSAFGGVAYWVPADALRRSMEGNGFKTYIVGDNPNAVQQERREDIRDVLLAGADVLGKQGLISQELQLILSNPENFQLGAFSIPQTFNIIITTPGLIEQFDDLYPGTTEDVAEYILEEIKNIEYLQDEYGIEPNAEQQLLLNANIRQWAEDNA